MVISDLSHYLSLEASDGIRYSQFETYCTVSPISFRPEFLAFIILLLHLSCINVHFRLSRELLRSNHEYSTVNVDDLLFYVRKRTDWKPVHWGVEKKAMDLLFEWSKR